MAGLLGEAQDLSRDRGPLRAPRPAGVRAGHVPLPLRRGPARGPPRGLHRHGHLLPLPAHATASTSCTPWASTPSACRRRTTPSRPAPTRGPPRRPTSRASAPRSRPWASPTTGTGRSPPTTRDYYRWTQWIFLKLWEKGLAYEAVVPINWCPSCKTGLANEEVKDGACERCGTPGGAQGRAPVDAAASPPTRSGCSRDLDKLDWSESPEADAAQLDRPQRGRQRASSRSAAGAGAIEVFTTRPDTLFGATYMVLAPEHPLVEQITTAAQTKAAVHAYVEQAPPEERPGAHGPGQGEDRRVHRRRTP